MACEGRARNRMLRKRWIVRNPVVEEDAVTQAQQDTDTPDVMTFLLSTPRPLASPTLLMTLRKEGVVPHAAYLPEGQESASSTHTASEPSFIQNRCFFNWGKCNSADAVRPKLGAASKRCRKTPKERQSLLHTDYGIGGGTEPGDDSAKIKPRALPVSLDDDVLIDKYEAAFICRQESNPDQHSRVGPFRSAAARSKKVSGSSQRVRALTPLNISKFVALYRR
ncbi:hypothetical protein Q8A73_005977 [Channa argus]|nr:hypothetical protein Q8A73_005977 [Channa argus]